MRVLTLQPVSAVAGEVTLPGSKSLSNRILLLAAVARGETLVENVLKSDDTDRMIEALRALGVQLTAVNERAYMVSGCSGPFSVPGRTSLFLGNAGTAMRPLAAVLCAGEGTYHLHGDPRMHERPIAHQVDGLRQLGARIRYDQDEGFPPLTIEAHGLSGGDVTVDGSISSQFLTALLMAAPLARSEVRLRIKGELVSRPYIDLTIDVLKRFGVSVREPETNVFHVPGAHGYTAPKRLLVEGDASSASYFLAAAAIKGGTVRVNGIGKDSVQGDAKFARFLERMGAVVRYSDTWVEVTRGRLHGIDADFNEIPDAAMTIAVAALFAQGKTVIRNVYNWRVKETDRLAAMATELRKTGALIEEGRDYIAIEPPKVLLSPTVDTYNDHRMAMCFSLIALGGVPVTINDPDCTAKTFPDYFDVFASICRT